MATAVPSDGALALAGCADNGDGASGDETYKIGINELVQHPALDSATEGFKEAFEDAGVEVEYDEQNANGEQSTALTIAPIDQQFEMIQELLPDATKIGIVYAFGEVNSKVQVGEAKKVAEPLGLEIVTQTVTNVTEIPQAVQAIGDVDAFYVPTDNLVVSGIASLVQAAEATETPVIAAEEGTVEGGAAIALIVPSSRNAIDDALSSRQAGGVGMLGKMGEKNAAAVAEPTAAPRGGDGVNAEDR